MKIFEIPFLDQIVPPTNEPVYGKSIDFINCKLQIAIFPIKILQIWDRNAFVDYLLGK